MGILPDGSPSQRSPDSTQYIDRCEKFFLLSNRPIKVFLLQEWLARSAQMPVSLTRDGPFYAANEISKGNIGCPEHVNMIGHHDIGMGYAEPTTNDLAQLMDYQTGDVRLRQINRFAPCSVQQPVPDNESLAGCEMFRVGRHVRAASFPKDAK